MYRVQRRASVLTVLNIGILLPQIATNGRWFRTD